MGEQRQDSTAEAIEEQKESALVRATQERDETQRKGSAAEERGQQEARTPGWMKVKGLDGRAG